MVGNFIIFLTNSTISRMKLHVTIQSPEGIHRIATERTLVLGSPIAMTVVVNFKCTFTLSLKRAMSAAVKPEFSVVLSLG